MVRIFGFILLSVCLNGCAVVKDEGASTTVSDIPTDQAAPEDTGLPPGELDTDEPKVKDTSIPIDTAPIPIDTAQIDSESDPVDLDTGDLVLPPLTLDLYLDDLDVEASTVNVYYRNSEPLWGYQFGLTGAIIADAYGGESDIFMQAIENSEALVLAFNITSLDGTPANSAYRLLIHLELAEISGPICIEQPQFLTPDAEEFAVSVGPCLDVSVP